MNDSPGGNRSVLGIQYDSVEITKTIDGKKLKPTAILTLDSTKVNARIWQLWKKSCMVKTRLPRGVTMVLIPRLPLPDEVIELLTAEDLP